MREELFPLWKGGKSVDEILCKDQYREAGSMGNFQENLCF